MVELERLLLKMECAQLNSLQIDGQIYGDQ